MTTNLLRSGIVLPAILLAAAAAVSCSSDDKSSADKTQQQVSQHSKRETTATASGGTRTVATTPGEAGGVIEEKATASATVQGIDPATRKVTLRSDEDGSTGAFIAPPEMRNFDQLKVGDRVKASIVHRLSVFVDDRGPAGPAKATTVNPAPKGSKPGALATETYEMVGTVKSIDTANRQAAIQFPNGQTKYVNVRPDVDLTRYKPGDNLVIQATQQVTVLTESP